MKSFLSLLLISLVFISCKKELQPQDSKDSSKVVPFTEAANLEQNQPAIQNHSPENQNRIPSSTTSDVRGMNPAHGQSGHRCDIAVGAPLNSPAVVPKSPAVASQNNSIASTTASPNTSTTPEGMNPPHGQENHRCDIAVGAPLPKE